MAQVEALDLIGADVGHGGEFGHSLDAFGDDGEVQDMAQAGDGTDNGCSDPAFGEGGDEASIDLDDVDRQLAKVGQGGISLRRGGQGVPGGRCPRATVVRAGRSWRSDLMAYALWGAQVRLLHGSHAADKPTFGAATDATGALLDGLEAPSLAAMNRGLGRGADLERLLTVLLATLFGLAVAVTAYFRRRTAIDPVRPMATMHQGVRRLQAGDFGHRIEAARLDELGELATAFNDMAAALHTSHWDLTVRATHDSLAGLLNRASLTEQLKASFAPSVDRRGRQPSVLFIDVDDFKNVNDTLGHEGGDVLLIQLAGRLGECVRPQDLLARLGGDEFGVIVLEDEDGSAAVGIAERICAACVLPHRQRHRIGGRRQHRSRPRAAGDR